MIKCKKCNVYINTNVRTCPLCNNEVDYKEQETKDIFPKITTIKKNGLWKKVLFLLFLVTIIICTLANYLISKAITWAIFVDLSVSCVALSIIIGYRQKRSLSNLLLLEYLFICAIAYYWDYITGQKLWSIKYVLPSISMIFIILNFVLRCVFRRNFINYYRNVLISSLCGIALMVLGIFNMIPSFKPLAYSAGILGIVTSIGMTIFDGKGVLEELKVRLHI